MENRRRAGVGGRGGGAATVAAAGLLALLAAARASAEVTSGNEEPLLPGAGPGVEASPAPPPDAGAAPSPPAPPPANDAEAPRAVEPPASSAAPGAVPAAFDRWPIEYVRRPQTLPAGMVGVAMRASAFRPADMVYVNQTTGVPYAYHSYFAIGARFEVGVTDMAEINLTVPRIVCFDGGDQPSGCSAYSRYDGTGADVEIGLVRDPQVQLEIQSGVAIGYTSPLVFRWSLATGLRLRAASWLALRVRAEIEEYADPPVAIPNPLLAFFTAAVDLQATRRLLLFGAAIPWGSVADVGQGIELELYGGASFSFTNRLQFELYGGAYNVLALPAWSHYIPGSFALTDLIFWHD